MKEKQKEGSFQGKVRAFANINPSGISAENVGSTNVTVSLPCNCGHAKEDHHLIETEFRTWCIYSEYGQCPCDLFTELDNLEFIERVSELKHAGYDRGNQEAQNC